ncbi:MAG: hypothetical protein M0Q24_11405 [Sulfurimonas sp.]|uniref:hypothetical protein n=1 Tax=Sulfurimonas sp. TaxID=2022749 RepID=UPI0025E76BA0|nr:hypothetical protein [Sulfurimonas sp.]MCK9492679.1 hypothetical protein [Sulfurimonas sp.]
MPNKGFENYLYINTNTTESPTWTEIDLAKDVTFNKDKGEIDGTSRKTARDGYSATEDGLKAWSAEFDSLIPSEDEDANAALAALDAAYRANTTVDVLRVRGGSVATDGCYAERVTCGVFGGSEGEPMNDMSTISYTLKNKAVPAVGTVSSSEFVAGS